jgi:hypothetical protein
MNALRSTSESGVERLSEILSEQNEGLTKEQWEKRLAALERIASSVRARRFQMFRTAIHSGIFSESP